MQGFTFDARTVAPITSLEPVPLNWYKVVIEKSRVKPSGTNPADNMIELSMNIIEGQFAGRKLFLNLNTFHTTSQPAVEMAYKQLSAVSHVTGQFNLVGQNTPDAFLPMLHNIPFYVYVVIGQGKNGPINNVSGYKDLNGNEPGKQAGGMPTQQPAAPNVGPQGGWNTGAPQGAAPQGGAPAGQWAQPQQPQAPQGGGQWQAPGGPAGAPQGAPSSYGAPAGYQPPQGAPQAGGPAPGGQWGPAPGGAWQAPGGAPQGGPQPQTQWAAQPQGGPAPGGPAPGGQWQQPQGGQPGPAGAGGPPQGAPSWTR